MNKRVFVFIIGAAIFLGCKTSVERKSPDVRHIGKLEDIMTGKAEGKLSLDSLASKQNLYAVGLRENMSGEIQILNGELIVSYASDDTIRIKKEYNDKAALLVYAEVVRWKEIPMPLSVTNTESLIGFLEYTAKDQGLNLDNPLVYLLEGKVNEVHWHVMKDRLKNNEQGAINHSEMMTPGFLEDTEVEIIGFYSNNHQGIFTHYNIPVHMHFVTRDRSIGGHVDQIDIGPGMTLKIPDQNR